MGEKNQHGQQNSGEISPVELRRSGMCNPIRVDISTLRHLGHGRCIRGGGENDSGNLFSFSFLRKDKNPLTHLRNSKYDDDQGGQTWPHESSDISEGEISKLPAGKHGTD